MDKTQRLKRRVRSVSKKIADDILDGGLATSTFRDNYPQAYVYLLKFRKDLALSAERILLKSSLGKPEG
jgi:hypothetical protein